VLKAHVTSVCFKCFRCFRGMLQLFQMNFTKVDRNVVYVAMAVHVCYKGLFSMFDLCFWMYCLQACLSGCCIRFTHMLQVFCLGIAYVAIVFKCF
jgi:hypothetical protein